MFKRLSAAIASLVLSIQGVGKAGDELELKFQTLPAQLKVDVGEFDAESTKVFPVRLRPKATGDLEIVDVKKNCSCVAVKRGKLSLEVELSATSQVGRFVQPLQVFFAGHETRPLTLLVEGRRRGLVEFAGPSSATSIRSDDEDLVIPVVVRDGWRITKASSMRGYVANLEFQQEGMVISGTISEIDGNVADLIRFELESTSESKARSCEIPLQIQHRFVVRSLPSKPVLEVADGKWVSRFTLIFDEPETMKTLQTAKFAAVSEHGQVMACEADIKPLNRRLARVMIVTNEPAESIQISGIDEKAFVRQFTR